MPAAVLDASAVLALLFEEPGYEAVIPYIGVGYLSVVNYSEVVARLSERGVPTSSIEEQIGTLALNLVLFDQSTALAAGLLRSATREFGLSLGDRACLATALRYGLLVVTTDREWAKLSLDLQIQVIR